MKSLVRSTTELAQILGLSRWTVSRALNGHSGIDPDTLQRIQEAARAHGFAPSLLGRGLRSGKTNLIGICLPDLVDYFLTDKISRLQDAIESRGFFPIMQMSGGSEKQEALALARFLAMHCAGIVSIASILEPSDPSVKALQASGTPFVKIDPLHHSRNFVVSSDRAWAMMEASKHLQSLGHKQIAIMGINPQTEYGRQRMIGLRAACEGKNTKKTVTWNFDRDLIFLNSEQTVDFQAGAEMAKKYISSLPSSSRPTAILALNDRIAWGAMSVLQAHGIRIPEDVSIIGYDNADFTPYTNPSLTSIDPRVNELIDQAVDVLLSQKDVAKPQPTLSIQVQPKLLIRESTGPAASRA